MGLGNAIYCILLQMLRESFNADFIMVICNWKLL